MLRHRPVTRQLIAMALMVAGCAGRAAPTPTYPSEHVADIQTSVSPARTTDEIEQLTRHYAGVPSLRTFRGKATYYSASLAGHPMASGEHYDPNRAQAAHRTLPFGTVVRVTSLDSSQSVVVRITDRGPYGGKGRIIDLSHAAAERLGLLRAGVADVRVDVLEIPGKSR